MRNLNRIERKLEKRKLKRGWKEKLEKETEREIGKGKLTRVIFEEYRQKNAR